MDKQRYERGLAMRKEVMGEDYVTRVMENAGEFGKEFQEYVTEMAWGGAWGRENGLSKRERSILNLGMLAAMGKSQEFAGHFKGAMRKGLSLEDLNEVLLQIFFLIISQLPSNLFCSPLSRSGNCSQEGFYLDNLGDSFQLQKMLVLW